MKKQTLFKAMICSAVLTIGATAVAQTTQSNAQPQAVAATATAKTLTIREVYDVLEKQGYRNITDIELDRHEYEVQADNAQGQRMELDVDARSGKIISERRDD